MPLFLLALLLVISVMLLVQLLLVAGKVSMQHVASGDHGAHGLGFLPDCNVHRLCSQDEEPAGEFQRS